VNTPERDGSLDIAGRRFAWRALGTGAPLLLMQGYAGSADDWAPDFLAALERSFALIAPDNRGVGASELGDPDEVTIDSMAADLEILLDELAIDRIHVAGFSMGGFIAQALAFRAPERIESLALLCTDPGGQGAIRAEAADWSRLVDRTGTPRERATRTISVCFPPGFALEFDRKFGEIEAASLAELDPIALAAHERAMDRWWGDSPVAADVAWTAPAAIGHGAEDIIIPPGNAELLATRFPAARVAIFPGAGHGLPAQLPEAAADLVASQLRP
jgi:pimeloyl-ACP methyl ester carboxylesterase